MKLLIMIVSVPLAGLFTWWGVSGARGGGSGMTEAFTIERKTFRVLLQEKGELKAAKSIDIKSEVSGRSTIITLVPEGSNVKKGDLLVELASQEIEEKIQSEEIQVTNAQAAFESAKHQLEILKEQNLSNIRQALLGLDLKVLELRKYDNGDWPQQLNDAKMRVAEAEMRSKQFKTKLENSKTLFDRKFIPRSELETDEFECVKAENELAKAGNDVTLLLEYTHVKDSKQKQSDVEEAEKELDRVKKEATNKEQEQESNFKAREAELQLKQQQLKKWKDQKEKSKIYAPADGMVVYGDGSSDRMWRGDAQIKEGGEVFERMTILQLPDTSQMKVTSRIHEAQTEKIKLGQAAVVTVEGISHRKFTGSITKIAALASSQSMWLNPELKEYETEITLNEHDELLKPGVTARVEILVAELNDVLAAPIQTVFSKGGRSFLFAGNSSSQAEPVEVQLGLASDQFVEIKSGVEAGQKVLLAVNDAVKHKLPEVSESEETAQRQPTPPGGAKTAVDRPAGERRGGGSGGMGGGGRPGGGGGGGGRRGPRGG